MGNPFLKKNPFLSMWLSGANSLAGSMRGHAVAQARRQASAAMTQSTRDLFDLWSGAIAPPSAQRRTKRRR